jgi:hypothetical protein
LGQQLDSTHPSRYQLDPPKRSNDYTLLLDFIFNLTQYKPATLHLPNSEQVSIMPIKKEEEVWEINVKSKKNPFICKDTLNQTTKMLSFKLGWFFPVLSKNIPFFLRYLASV